MGRPRHGSANTYPDNGHGFALGWLWRSARRGPAVLFLYLEELAAMSLTYRTICDICNNTVEGWPEHSQTHPGWMTIHVDPLVQWHVCDQCAPHVHRALESLKSERMP